MGRNWYEVRIREQITPPKHVEGKWISGRYAKKSKFYFTNGPQEAARKYKGKGQVMHVEKIGVEKLLGIGEFFKLGDTLLQEFKEGGTLLGKIEGTKDKRRQRIHYNKNIRRGSSD